MNAMIKIGITIGSLILLISSLAAAYSIKIDVSPNFSAGETISFDYTITQEDNSAPLINYFATVSCPKAPIVAPNEKIEMISTGSPLTGSFSYIAVDENTEPQKCKAIVQIISPVETTEEKEFEILTPQSFDFQVKTCKDSSCTEKTKVFPKGSAVFIGFDSSAANPSTTGILTMPDQTTKTITLPTSITAEQTGNYSLSIQASKEGYKTKKTEYTFGIIEKQANIPFTAVAAAGFGAGLPDYLLFLAIGIAIIIVIIALALAIRRRSGGKEQVLLGMKKALEKK